MKPSARRDGAAASAAASPTRTAKALRDRWGMRAMVMASSSGKPSVVSDIP